MAKRFKEHGVTNERIGVAGLGGGMRTPERTIMHGTFSALEEAFPRASFADVSDLQQEARERNSKQENAALQCLLDLVECANDAQVRAAQHGVPDYVV